MRFEITIASDDSTTDAIAEVAASDSAMIAQAAKSLGYNVARFVRLASVAEAKRVMACKCGCEEVSNGDS